MAQIKITWLAAALVMTDFGAALAQDISQKDMSRAIDAALARQRSAAAPTTRGLMANDHQNAAGYKPIYGAAPAPPPPTAEAMSLFNMSILFKSGSADVEYASIPQLRELATALRDSKYSRLSFNIVGHTDATGPADANQRLSERRAVAVVQVLINNAVNPLQLTALGKGETDPIDLTNGASARNRRVELQLKGG